MKIKQKILIVDDTPANLHALIAVLENIDVEIVTSSNGNDAIIKAFFEEFDLILMDVQMPNMDGFEAVKLIKKEEKNKYIPVLFLTATTYSEKNVLKGIESGAIDFITKPFSEDILIGKVKLFLKMQHQTKELKIIKNELKTANSHLEKLAYYDSLTGLLNRRAFVMELNDVIKEASDNKELLAVLFLDLEKFKSVNDTHGHDKGDILLKAVAGRLRGIIGQNDIIARLGGDEFIICLKNIDSEFKAEETAAKINFAFCNKFLINNISIDLTVSIGISYYPNDSNKSDELIRYSDLAMYKAKQTGENSYRVFHNQYEDELLIENDLLNAIKNNEIFLYYQPIIDLHNKVYAIQALPRWISEKHGIKIPGFFIPILAKNKKLIEFGDFAFNQICKKNAQLTTNSNFSDIVTSVNLSPIQFQDDNLIDKFLNIVKITGADPGKIQIEVPGITADYNFEDTINKLHKLKDLHFIIVTHDFGFMFSSLKFTSNIPVNIFKIDTGIITKITYDNQALHFVKLIIEMMKSMNIKVVASGVENSDQFDLLKSNGCDYFQGFSINKPVKDIDKFLAEYWEENHLSEQ